MPKLPARRIRYARCVGVEHRKGVASSILHEPVRTDVLVARRCCDSDSRRLHGLGEWDFCVASAPRCTGLEGSEDVKDISGLGERGGDTDKGSISGMGGSGRREGMGRAKGLANECKLQGNLARTKPTLIRTVIVECSRTLLADSAPTPIPETADSTQLVYFIQCSYSSWSSLAAALRAPAISIWYSCWLECAYTEMGALSVSFPDANSRASRFARHPNTCTGPQPQPEGGPVDHYTHRAAQLRFPGLCFVPISIFPGALAAHPSRLLDVVHAYMLLDRLQHGHTQFASSSNSSTDLWTTTHIALRRPAAAFCCMPSVLVQCSAAYRGATSLLLAPIRCCARARASSDAGGIYSRVEFAAGFPVMQDLRFTPTLTPISPHCVGAWASTSQVHTLRVNKLNESNPIEPGIGAEGAPQVRTSSRRDRDSMQVVDILLNHGCVLSKLYKPGVVLGQSKKTTTLSWSKCGADYPPALPPGAQAGFNQLETRGGYTLKSLATCGDLGARVEELVYLNARAKQSTPVRQPRRSGSQWIQTNSEYRWNWGGAGGGASSKRRESVKAIQLTMEGVIDEFLEHVIGLSESNTMHRARKEPRAENEPSEPS
ncbi:hypothetical protein B0H13DRAFT_1932597 [Mycena leptocephala]|nr:hypothetical protein B0H13DRAFT_1932597 [Mycena leptocephala]